MKKLIYTLHAVNEADEEVDLGVFDTFEKAETYANTNDIVEYIIIDDEDDQYAA